MKSLLSFTFFITTVFVTLAQTPIDDLQKQNIDFLEIQESKGYEFRSQIITEFDPAHASQNVNIKLSTGFTYVIVALGDSNIPAIGLAIKPSTKSKIVPLEIGEELVGQSFLLTPSKSGNFKISINALNLKASEKGFISFMVLRKN